MKEEVYRIIVDIWRMICKYQFRKLSDDEWERFVSDGERLLERYKGNRNPVEMLCRDLFQCVQAFYEHLDGQENM